MATRPETMAHLLDILPGTRASKMFGEYGFYLGPRLVGLICDDQLFIKSTDAGRAYIGKVIEAPPYKGAKPSLLISGDRLEDGEWLAELVRRTAEALPTPSKKPRRRK